MTNYKKILSIVLIALAYGYLGYKILTYDNYAEKPTLLDKIFGGRFK